jgi:hypothetical protein
VSIQMSREESMSHSQVFVWKSPYSPRLEKVGPGEEQSQEHAHKSFVVKGIVHKEYILVGQSILHTTRMLYSDCKRICEDVRFEVFTAVTMKNGVFWHVTTCGSCKNRRFGGT